jgi:serine/threonine protein kinase
VIGDPRYISPEQILGKTGVDARADLYSVGVALYLALTGRLPFEGASDIDVLSAHVSAAPVPPRSINPEISAPLEAAVLRALRKNPDERFATAAAFREALAAPPPAVQPPLPAITPRTSRAPIAVASILLAAAIAGWIVLR